MLEKKRLIELLKECFDLHYDVYKDTPLDERVKAKHFQALTYQMFKMWALKDLKRTIKRCKDYDELVRKCKISAILGKGFSPQKQLKHNADNWRIGFTSTYLDMVKEEIDKQN